MPELPEVETVRVGLEAAAVGRVIETVEVIGPRTVRRERLDVQRSRDRTQNPCDVSAGQVSVAAAFIGAFGACRAVPIPLAGAC